MVERWRAAVRVEARDLPPDLVLAYIDRESNGIPGRVAYADVRIPYTDAERACGLPVAYARRALGLLQVAPVTWRNYVANTGDRVTPCDLAGRDVVNGPIQIRVGAAALRSALKFAGWSGEQLPSDAIVLMSRLAYARGAGALQAKLAEARAAGFPATFDGIEAFDPTWGRPDRPFDGARGILRKYRAALGLGPPPITTPPRSSDEIGGGAILPILVLVGLWAWFSLK